MTIRWGIIGCGDVCERKSGPGFQRAEGSELVAVMRRDRRLAEDFARRHGVPHFYDDAAQLVHDSTVDAVYVATPPGTHLKYALLACSAGKPAYVEKPMARNHDECLTMVSAFASAGLPLFVAYYRRSLERFRALREIVLSGRLGVITGISYRFSAPRQRALGPSNVPWRQLAEEAGAGLFLDLGSHALDLLDFMFGPLSDVQGTARNCASAHDVEDTVAMSFVTQTGVPGTAHWFFAADTEQDWLEIHGTEGRVSASVFQDQPLTLSVRGQQEQRTVAHPAVIQQPLIQAVVNALQSGSECPSTGVSAARTSAVMDRVLSSYYGTRSGEFWRDPRTWPGRRAPSATEADF